VKAGEGDHIDSKFPQVSIELTWEAEASGDTGHGQGDKMVQVTIGGVGEPESTEADVIESLIVNAVGLKKIFHHFISQEGRIFSK
jgi:hypothetical protein